MNLPANRDDDQRPQTLPASGRTRHTPGRMLARQVRFLAHSTYLEEAGPPRAVAAMVWLIAVLVFGAVVWAAGTQIDESASTEGIVMPSGSVQLVQHLEGGIVQRVLVSEGEIVEAGQKLLRLDEASARSELEQRQTRLAALRLKAERLRAFAEDREPNFTTVAVDNSGLVSDQWAILRLQREARDSQLQVLDDQIADREVELENLQRHKVTLQKDLSLIREELEMRGELLKKGLMSRIVYLDVQRAANKARGDIRETEGDIVRAQRAIAEANSRRAELGARLRNEALTEMGAVTAEMAELNQALERSENRVDRLDVVSPVRGAVKNITIKTVGGVVAPGAVIMEIVPVDDELVVETRISTLDIGHVAVGQKALVKVATFDYARFGGLEGELTRVSASTFLDEEGQPYYKGVVHLAQNYVGKEPGRNLVLPGMTVQADINTGQRTLLQYLLAPVYRAVSESFRER